MKYAPSSLSLSLMIAGLLAGTAIVAPQKVSAAASDLQAQTGWAITRVASMSQGSYCTMAQRFNNDTVMTIAKNNGGEYSLAFDFQSAKFQPGRTTTVSVRAGSGSTQTFEAQPTSAQAIVIGLGSDEAFINNVKSSGNVQLDIGGDSYSFNTVKFAEGQDEMTTCMSSMKSQMREAKNDAPAPAAQNEAQKAEAAEAQKVAAAEPVPVSQAAPSQADLAPASKLSAEDLTAAPVEPLKAPVKTSRTVAAPVPAAEVVASSSSSDEAGDLRAENVRLKRSLEDARRTYENQMTAQQGARVPELQEKIRVLDMENSKLKDEVAKNATSAQSKEDLTRVAAELDKARKDLAMATEQNKSLQTQVADAVAGKQDAAKATQTIQQSQRELDTLKAENQTLKNQLQIAAKAEPAAPAPDSEKLKAENESLKAQLAKAVATVNAAAVAGKGAPAADTAQEQEISYLRAENEKLVKDLAAVKPAAGKPLGGASAELQKRVSELQAENASLKAQVANTDTLTPMPSAAPEAPLSSADQENLRGQIRDLRSQLEIVESESAGLRKQLETAQKESEGKQIKAAGGSWDLEQATRRYQESQREIRRLGGLLEEDRVKCAQEKKDIEYMLFDPEIAKPAQISMLNNLEDQIQEKDTRIAQLEGSLRSNGVEPAPAVKAEVKAAPAPKVESEQLLAADVKPMSEKAPDQPKTEAKIEAPIPPMAVAAAAVPAPAPVAAVSAAPSSADVKFQSSQDFTGILKSAGVSIRGAVQAMPKVSSDTYKAYSWQTDSLYGSAEQRSMSSQSAFEPAVQQYIDRAKSRCAGDFAAVPAQIKGTIPAEGYEIACVTGQSGSSASVLFTYKDGVMTTVAHEGRAEAMDIAMDARDRVASKIVAN